MENFMVNHNALTYHKSTWRAVKDSVSLDWQAIYINETKKEELTVC